MNDLISRKMAIDALEQMRNFYSWDDCPNIYAEYKRIIDEINNLPSAQPQWIPCGERLPEHDGELYLVTDYCVQISRKRVHLSYCYTNREGFWSDVPIGYKVIAWMPLPKAWEGES